MDAFLEVAVEHEKKASAYKAMVQDFTKLPKRELYALAEGKSKLAYLCGGSDEWLEKYEGTPFHEQALALEQESLELEIAREQKRLAKQQEREAEREECDEEWRQQDAIRLKKRILDLELNKHKLQASGGGETEEEEGEELEAEEPEEGEEDEEDEEDEAEAEEASPVEKAASIKLSAVLTGQAREKIKSKNFAVKGGKYPIHDPKHARNALTRVRQFGSPSEKAQVFKAVSKKYPALATRSEVVPQKLQRKAEKKVGVSKGQESQKREKPLQKVSAVDPAGLAVATPVGLAAGATKDIFTPGLAGYAAGRMGRYAENADFKPGEMGPGTGALMGSLGGGIVGGAAGGAPGAAVGRALGAGGGAYLGYTRSKKPKAEKSEKKGKEKKAQLENLGKDAVPPGTDFDNDKKVGEGKGPMPAKVKGMLRGKEKDSACGSKHASILVKQAAAFGLTPEEFEQLQKEAFGGAMLAGLKGAGQFIRKAAPTVGKAFKGAKGQGMQFGKGMEALKGQASRGVGRAARWAGKTENRGAALGLAGAGLGGAALLGRATA